jgi:hypothetical protein
MTYLKISAHFRYRKLEELRIEKEHEFQRSRLNWKQGEKKTRAGTQVEDAAYNDGKCDSSAKS